MLGTDECPVMNVQDFAGRKIKNCDACLDDSTKVGKASINVFGYEWICMNQYNKLFQLLYRKICLCQYEDQMGSVFIF